MPDQDMLLGELKEFKRQTIEQHGELKGEIRQLRVEVQKLWAWRWKIAGMATLAAWISGIVVELIRR